MTEDTTPREFSDIATHARILSDEADRLFSYVDDDKANTLAQLVWRLGAQVAELAERLDAKPDPQCDRCGRYPALGDTPENSVDTSLVDPQWDGDGNLCTDCYDDEAPAWHAFHFEGGPRPGSDSLKARIAAWAERRAELAEQENHSCTSEWQDSDDDAVELLREAAQHLDA